MIAWKIEEKVAEYAKERNLCTKGDRVIVALSGGADSVALLRVLLSIGVECSALHCNFGLRGAESNRDEVFVRNLCNQWGVALKVKQFDVASYEREHKVSTEMACRELRYMWFEDERREQGVKAIAVAHHYDDNVETFFLNMLRGTGIQGLTGIRARNGYVIRPLLCVSREEIEAYLNEIAQDYMVDSTNLENDFKRNKIRNVLIPTLNKLFPEYAAGVSRTLQNLQGCNEFYQNAVDALRAKAVEYEDDNVVKIKTEPLREMKCGRETAIFELIKGFGFNSHTAELINRAIDDSRNVGIQFLSDSYCLTIGREDLEVFRVEDEDYTEVRVNLNDLLQADDDRVGFTASLESKKKGEKRINGIDGKRTVALSVKILEENPEMIIRRWLIGDFISPFGMNGSKLLSDLFADNKYSAYQKQKARILTLANDEIFGDRTVLWVMNLRASRHYAVGADDESYVKLTMK